jgi:hypothetical protein
MNKWLLCLILSLTIIGCKKDDAGTKQKDYTYFLKQTTPKFQGKLNNEAFTWIYGQQCQSMAGYQNGSGICDSTDPVRMVLYGLTLNSDFQQRYVLYSPKYNTSSETEFARVFTVGKKTLGTLGADFYLSITRDNKIYQTNANNENEIEILKTQEFTDYLGDKLRVWFKLNAKLTPACGGCQSDNLVLSDGILLTEFYGFRKK